MRSEGEVRARLDDWLKARRRRYRSKSSTKDLELAICKVAIDQLRWMLGGGGGG